MSTIRVGIVIGTPPSSSKSSTYWLVASLRSVIRSAAPGADKLAVLVPDRMTARAKPRNPCAASAVAMLGSSTAQSPRLGRPESRTCLGELPCSRRCCGSAVRSGHVDAVQLFIADGRQGQTGTARVAWVQDLTDVVAWHAEAGGPAKLVLIARRSIFYLEGAPGQNRHGDLQRVVEHIRRGVGGPGSGRTVAKAVRQQVGGVAHEARRTADW